MSDSRFLKRRPWSARVRQPRQAGWGSISPPPPAKPRPGKSRHPGSISYLLRLTGGFVGLHRFYPRASKLGFGYVFLFVLVLYGNKQSAIARNGTSEALNAFKGAEFGVRRFTKALSRGRDGAAEKLAKYKQNLISAREQLADANIELDQWLGFPGVAANDIPLWFGVVYMVNMQMTFLSPPFGFYLKSVAPPEITMGIIFRSALPFLLIQAIGLAICMIFPQTILWLPKLVYE